MKRQRELFEIVGALGAGRGLANLLHRGNQEADQDGDDGDDDQQLNQREAVSAHGNLKGDSIEESR
jgi:hypothetical protein